METGRHFLRKLFIYTLLVLAAAFTGYSNWHQYLPIKAEKTPSASPRHLTLTEQTDKLPSANTQAFKGLGDLAFVQDGLLYILEGKSGQVTRITSTGKAGNPRWSSDGNWLAYIKCDNNGSTGSLWLTQRDGNGSRQITELPDSVYVSDYTWSPSQNMLAICCENDIWLMPAKGKAQKLVNTDDTVRIAWSPDGNSLAYNQTLPYDPQSPETRSDALYTIDIHSKKKSKQLTAPEAGIGIVAWWPNGKGILYWIDPCHSASIAADGLDLFSLELGKKKPVALPNGLPFLEWLSLSADGHLLMVSGGGREQWQNKRLVMVDIYTGATSRINPPKGCVALDPALSPDGKYLTYTTAKEFDSNLPDFSKPGEYQKWINSFTLWIERIDSSKSWPLPNAGQGIFKPAWSKDGKHILYICNNSLWMINSSGQSRQRILGPFLQANQLNERFYGLNDRSSIAWYQS